MSSIERFSAGQRVCFRNLLKRFKPSDKPMIEEDKSLQSVHSNNGHSTPTECSTSKQCVDLGDEQHNSLYEYYYDQSRSTTGSHESITPFHDDTEYNFNFSRKRAKQESSLFRCFRSRAARCTDTKKHASCQHNKKNRKSTSRNELNNKDEVELDIIEGSSSGIATPTKVITITKSQESSTVRRKRSRFASFYSAISFQNDDELPQRFGSILHLFSIHSKSKNQLDHQSLDDSSDLSDFYSVDENDFDIYSLQTNQEKSTGFHREPSSEAVVAYSSQASCSCGYDFHLSMYSPEFPLISGPGIIPDSYEERLAIANACTGCWETIVERSETLDPQYRCVGLGMVKRVVMNRLAIPLTMFLEDNDSILHCWIHTPLGIRHMRSNLRNQELMDDDPDAGKWLGITHAVNFSVPWFCNGKEFRAIQQVRRNSKVGTAIETRCILPDKTEGKIMLFQFVMIPIGKTEKDMLKADRILRYKGPKRD